MALTGDGLGDPLGVLEEGPRGGCGRVREGVGQALTETFDALEGLVRVQAKCRTDLGPVLGGHVSTESGRTACSSPMVEQEMGPFWPAVR